MYFLNLGMKGLIHLKISFWSCLLKPQNFYVQYSNLYMSSTCLPSLPPPIIVLVCQFWSIVSSHEFKGVESQEPAGAHPAENNTMMQTKTLVALPVMFAQNVLWAPWSTGVSVHPKRTSASGMAPGPEQTNNN